jgi:hypothetical protein
MAILGLCLLRNHLYDEQPHIPQHCALDYIVCAKQQHWVLSVEL